jgi:hypothetical protein
LRLCFAKNARRAADELDREADRDGGGFEPNTRAGHAAEIGSGNGITNARGLAGLYGPLANGGPTLVGADTLTRMSRVSVATHDDATLRIPTRWAPASSSTTAARP